MLNSNTGGLNCK